MRIWDIPPQRLCRKHLLGEHSELHALWTILTQEKRGFANHPETARWKGKLRALYLRHDTLVREMEHRGYNHKSPLDRTLAEGSTEQNVYIDSPERQMELLGEKKCRCLLDALP